MTLYSPFFLLAFLPASAVVYNTTPRKAKMALLCALSLAFYIFAAGKFFFVLPCLALVTYALSFLGKKGFFICLAMLPILRMLGIFAVGVSFFIVRAASYIYDGYREKNFLKVLGFLMFFPCIHAGPLVRYGDMQNGFEQGVNYTRVLRGICLLLVGTIKKLFFADTLYSAFDLFHCGSTSLSALLALVSYALYIYFDFSGCSDMARGISGIFGFEIPKNFDFPYMSKSVTEFFRRWHITLGKWLFDYVYIPLGGSRCGKVRMVMALLATWLVSALWHGSALSYFFWGLYFFLICTAEKLLFPKGKGIGRCGALLLVLFGWGLFFSKTPADAYAFFYRLFALGNTLLYCRADIYNFARYLPFMLLAAICTTPLFHSMFCAMYKKARALFYIAAPAAFAVVLCCLAVGGHMPFLYATF